MYLVLFTIIPVPVAFDAINRKLTESINLTGTGSFLVNTCFNTEYPLLQFHPKKTSLAW